MKNTDKNTQVPQSLKTAVISRLSSENALNALNELYENMSNPNIVEPLKELLERDGYKAGFCDGFRSAIDYIKNGL